jgi:hypothetical protein
MLSAFDWSVGYDNSSPSVRFWWNDNFGSEISLAATFTDQISSLYTVTDNFDISITPVLYPIINNEYGRLSLGIRLRTQISYYSGGSEYNNFTSAHNYGIYLVLPEIEVKVPYISGFYAVARLGVGATWSYNNYGKLNPLTVSLYGVSLGSLGFSYYFGPENGGKQQVDAPPAQQRAATVSPSFVTTTAVPNTATATAAVTITAVPTTATAAAVVTTTSVINTATAAAAVTATVVVPNASAQVEPSKGKK